MRTWNNESMHANLEYEGAKTFISIRHEISLMSEKDKKLAREIVEQAGPNYMQEVRDDISRRRRK